MTMSNSAEEKPATKEEASPSSFPLSSLPDELALSCLARVPRSDHAALSLVSRRFHSLVLSPEFYKIRLQLGRTEKRLYVCITTDLYSTPHWFNLRRLQTQIKTQIKTYTVNRLRWNPIPSFPSQPLDRSSMVVLDWGIYVIGGVLNQQYKPTSDISLLDCRTNTWRQVPSMGTARIRPGAGVVGGKIYVFGGRPDDDSTNWGEIFDPKTQTWDTLVPLLDRSERDSFIRDSLVMEEKVYAVKWFEGCVYYNPSEGKWGRTNKPDLLIYCFVEKLLYGFDVNSGNVYWRESDESEWKHVKGLENLEDIFDGELLGPFLIEKHICQVSNFGVNKVVVFWLEHNDDDVEICCAQVSLERREEKGEVWGTVECTEVVYRVDDAPFLGRHVRVLCSAFVNV